MFHTIFRRLASLTFGLWLMAGVMALFAVGSFVGGGEASTINDLPLFFWLQTVPVAESWWLWVIVALLALLALNTVLCSIDSLRAKLRGERFLVLIAPQVMHLGFLCIVLAHLLSAWGGVKEVLPVMEGEVVAFPGGSRMQVANIQAQPGPMGVPLDFSAAVRFAPDTPWQTISPNHPAFHRGFGIYLKQVQIEPVRGAFLEIHREPGAGAALAGALLFTAGNIVLLAVRRGR